MNTQSYINMRAFRALDSLRGVSHLLSPGNPSELISRDHLASLLDLIADELEASLNPPQKKRQE